MQTRHHYDRAAPALDASRFAALRDRREAQRSERLAHLLKQRPDLVGVHPPADWAVEAVRWSA